MLLGRNLDFLSGFVVATARYLSVTTVTNARSVVANACYW